MTRVLVVGGGIAGLSAALASADAGLEVLLVEAGPFLGGKRSALLVDGPDGEMSVDLPALASLAEAGIETRSLTRASAIKGEPGNFQVTLEERGRFVTSDCTRCGRCLAVCPEITVNEFDAGLTNRKAIFGYHQGIVPHEFTIDLSTCLNDPPNYLPCQRCSDACDDQAIDFNMVAQRSDTGKFDAVILANGFDSSADMALLHEFGYGSHADIVTMVELQRMLEAPGPSGGFAVRPSNEDYVESALLVLPQQSPFSNTMISQQARTLAAQDIEALHLLILDPPDQAVVPEDLPAGTQVSYGAWLGSTETEPGALETRFVDLTNKSNRQVVTDIVVLATGRQPDHSIDSGALVLDASGYIVTDESGATSIPGIYAAGGATGSYTIEAAVSEARCCAAALAARFGADQGILASAGGWDELTQAAKKQRLEQLLLRLLEKKAS